MNSLQPTGYLPINERKITGAHYTPKHLADFVAEKIVQEWHRDKNGKKIQILDPAVGDGSLLISSIEQLTKHKLNNFEIHGFDTDETAISMAKYRLRGFSEKVPLFLKVRDFLEYVLYQRKPDLLNINYPVPQELFDMVIANPPYIRTQTLGSKKSQELSKNFGLSGRVDLSYAFIHAIASILKPGAIAGIIISNRFMTVKSGQAIRKEILKQFDIIHIWDLGDTKLFEASVLPAVLLLKKKNGNSGKSKPRFTAIYSVNKTKSNQLESDIIKALNHEGIIKVGNNTHFQVKQGWLKADDVWRISTNISDKWLEAVDKNTYCTFSQIGKIRVGVKTTADKVFIKTDWKKLPADEIPEVLKPLITHHVASRFKANLATKNYEILYTHQIVNHKRVTIDLEKLPKTKKYLSKNQDLLTSRDYVTKAGRKWFEIWVPHDPASWSKPKIVFRDISEQPMFWLDLSGAVVNGDCYWLTNDNLHNKDLLWLALAVGNSEFIEKFYDHKFNNKLYSGRRRFITQYVEKFPLPNPKKKVSKEIIELTKKIYKLKPLVDTTKVEALLNELVLKAFGFNQRNS